MRRLKLPKYLYLLVLIPLMIHGSAYIYLRTYFYSHIRSEPLSMGLIHQRGTGDVELLGIYGDAFDPRAKNVDFDVVVVSAAVNPIAILKGDLGNIIVWQQNSLLHSALVSTFRDSAVFQKAIEEMVVSMGANGNLVQYFLSPDFKIKDDYLLKDLVHVYFWDVPDQGPFHTSTGINSMVAVPIFDPRYIYENLPDLDKLHSHLQDNVYVVVKRAIQQLGDVEDQKPYSVNAIAIPALAGTCCRLDSWMYLDYSASYFTILEALEDSKIPNPVDRVYMIAYDKLPTTLEESTSLEALFHVFRYYRMRYWLEGENIGVEGPALRALVWILPVWLLSIFTHRQKTRLLHPGPRQTFLLSTIALASAYSVVAIPVNETILLLSKWHPIILGALDVLFGFTSALALAWLNSRFVGDNKTDDIGEPVS